MDADAARYPTAAVQLPARHRPALQAGRRQEGARIDQIEHLGPAAAAAARRLATGHPEGAAEVQGGRVSAGQRRVSAESAPSQRGVRAESAPSQSRVKATLTMPDLTAVHVAEEDSIFIFNRAKLGDGLNYRASRMCVTNDQFLRWFSREMG